MPVNPEHLITRQPILNHDRELAFIRLAAAAEESGIVTAFMCELANIEMPHAVYLVPIAWVRGDEQLMQLGRDTILVSAADAASGAVAERARELGFRIAQQSQCEEIQKSGCDFMIRPLGANIAPSKTTIVTGIDTLEDASLARDGGALYVSGAYFMKESAPVAGGKRINPGYAQILELISAVQQEAEPSVIETMFQRNITLSFKLLRYINSSGFGLMLAVKTVRQALSMIGYRQLMKWLTLVAVTAGRDTPPILTHTAMVRAKHMELIGAKLLNKREADNLFVTGMLSLLDHIMGVPMNDILQHVNLSPMVIETLTKHDGKYRRFLALTQACEGIALPDDVELDDIDTRTVNSTHLEAIEWATQVGKISLS